MCQFYAAKQIIDRLISGNQDPNTPHRQWRGRLCVVMRGLPGSGKSTFAAEVQMHAAKAGLRAMICSADHAFCSLRGGYKYIDSRAAVAEAHQKCQTKFRSAVEDQAGPDVIIVDNTNIEHWEFRFYEEVCLTAGLRCQIVQFVCTSEYMAEDLFMRAKHPPPRDHFMHKFATYDVRTFNQGILMYSDRVLNADPFEEWMYGFSDEVQRLPDYNRNDTYLM